MNRLSGFRDIRNWFVLSCIALVMLSGFAVKQSTELAAYRRYAESVQQKNFYGRIESASGMENELAKLSVSDEAAYDGKILSGIREKAESLRENISALPRENLQNTVRFVNQLGDYAGVLQKACAGGKNLSADDKSTLRSLYDSCRKMNSELYALEYDLSVGAVSWNELSYPDGNVSEAASFSGSMESLESANAELPSLIYDGPFSDTRKDPEVKGLSGEDISRDDAEKAASEFLGSDAELHFYAESVGNIPCFIFDYMTEITCGLISVTKAGGKVLSMTSSSGTGPSDLSIEECRAKAVAFLAENGFGEMEATYSAYYDGTATINCAAVSGDIILYPDLVKVKISMADGTVCGLEAMNYWLSHTERMLPAPAVGREEAEGAVPEGYELVSCRQALIPLDSGAEAFCWELHMKSENEDFLLYKDAETGAETNILKIIHTPNGELTQ